MNEGEVSELELAAYRPSTLIDEFKDPASNERRVPSRLTHRNKTAYKDVINDVSIVKKSFFIESKEHFEKLKKVES